MLAITEKFSCMPASFFFLRPSFPCECRKPGTLLYRRAAEQFDIDLASSLYVGDRDRDVAPGVSFDGFARLVPSPSTPEAELDLARERGLLATSLGECVDAYLKQLR